MKIFTPGHLYELENFEAKNKPGQTIQFIEKEPASPGSSKLVTIADGTTNEEVLRVLIDRLRFLGEKLPSRENSLAATRLEEALLWLEKRTRDRQARGVEGTRNI
jgi:hypothetical protein